MPNDIAKTSPQFDTTEVAHGTSKDEGRTTGEHQIAVGELFAARAEWRSTNLASGGDPWLQLRLVAKRSSVRDDDFEFNLDVKLNRVHVFVDLNGASSHEREEWKVASSEGLTQLSIDQQAIWEEERPAFVIENAEDHQTIEGTFEWFDFIEVHGEIGKEAIIEFGSPINSVTVSLPEAVKQRLDINKVSQYKVPEQRLAEYWKLTRHLRPSERGSGGLVKLAAIKLMKEH